MPDLRTDAIDVINALRRAGHVAYLAGGCVRDELLGDDPKDYDVATSAAPPAVIEVFGERRTQAVGQAFGVMLVKSGQSQIEVATFRRDADYADGRRPDSVVFTNAEEDARRRDFTINGLFKDPLDEDQIIDHVGGRRDLEARLIRAIGAAEQRFGEDYLRLLRAVRFAARLGFDIEPGTWEAIKLHAPRLARISPERIADEMRRMLIAPTRGQAWQLLWDSGLLEVVLRTLPIDIPPRPARTDVMDYVAQLDRPVSFALAIAAMLVQVHRSAGWTSRRLFEPHHIDTSVRAARAALRLSNEDTDALSAVLRIGTTLHDDPATDARMMRFLASDHADDARTLLAAMASDEATADRHAQLTARLKSLEATDYRQPPKVTGADLIAAGLEPGPAFKTALDEAYDAQLEARATAKDELLQIAIDASK